MSGAEDCSYIVEDLRRSFAENEVCKPYLLGLCPYQVFQGLSAKCDGICDKHHEPYHQESYRMSASKRERHQYELEQLLVLAKVVNKCDIQVMEKRGRLKHKSATVKSYQHLQMEFFREVDEMLIQTEKAGIERLQRADEIQPLHTLLKVVEKFRKIFTRDDLARNDEKKGEGAMLLDVCGVCAEVLYHDEKSLQHHEQDQRHQNFKTIRFRLEELNELRMGNSEPSLQTKSDGLSNTVEEIRPPDGIKTDSEVLSEEEAELDCLNKCLDKRESHESSGYSSDQKYSQNGCSPIDDDQPSASRSQSTLMNRVSYRSRSCSKSQSISRSKSRSMSRLKSRSTSRSKSLSNSLSRSRSKSRSGSRSRIRLRSRSKIQSNIRSKGRSKSPSKSISMSRSKNQSRSRSKSRSKSRSRSRLKSRLRSRSKSQSKNRSKSRSRSRSRSRLNSGSKSQSKSRSRSRSKSRLRSRSKRRLKSGSEKRSKNRSESRSSSNDRFNSSKSLENNRPSSSSAEGSRSRKRLQNDEDLCKPNGTGKWSKKPKLGPKTKYGQVIRNNLKTLYIPNMEKKEMYLPGRSSSPEPKTGKKGRHVRSTGSSTSSRASHSRSSSRSTSRSSSSSSSGSESGSSRSSSQSRNLSRSRSRSRSSSISRRRSKKSGSKSPVESRFRYQSTMKSGDFD